MCPCEVKCIEEISLNPCADGFYVYMPEYEAQRIKAKVSFGSVTLIYAVQVIENLCFVPFEPFEYPTSKILIEFETYNKDRIVIPCYESCGVEVKIGGHNETIFLNNLCAENIEYTTEVPYENQALVIYIDGVNLGTFTIDTEIATALATATGNTWTINNGSITGLSNNIIEFGYVSNINN